MENRKLIKILINEEPLFRQWFIKRSGLPKNEAMVRMQSLLVADESELKKILDYFINENPDVLKQVKQELKNKQPYQIENKLQNEILNMRKIDVIIGDIYFKAIYNDYKDQRISPAKRSEALERCNSYLNKKFPSSGKMLGEREDIIIQDLRLRADFDKLHKTKYKKITLGISSEYLNNKNALELIDVFYNLQLMDEDDKKFLLDLLDFNAYINVTQLIMNSINAQTLTEISRIPTIINWFKANTFYILEKWEQFEKDYQQANNSSKTTSNNHYSEQRKGIDLLNALQKYGNITPKQYSTWLPLVNQQPELAMEALKSFWERENFEVMMKVKPDLIHLIKEHYPTKFEVMKELYLIELKGRILK